MSSYISPAEKTSYDAALYGVFETFMRPFQLYLEAQTAVVSTAPSFAGMFGDQSQNVTDEVVRPKVYALSGCINYGNKQPWEYIAPEARGDHQQNKIRESFGTVRIKVDATGYALLKDCKQVVLDGFTFQLNSNARPHGLIGAPNRYTFTLQKVD